MAGTVVGRRWLERRAITGPTTTASGYSITPLSSVLIVRCSFGALVWQRPLAILVEHDGQQKHLPIRNVTRLAQLALSSAVLVLTIALQRRESRRKEHQP